MYRKFYGIAWYDMDLGLNEIKPYYQTGLAKLNANYYYNDKSFQQLHNGHAFPMMRFGPIQPDNPRFWTNVINVLGSDYNGYMLLMNEPEIDNQDNMLPLSASWIVKRVKTLMPKCKIVGPNIVANQHGLNWLANYLSSHNSIPFDAWGIHIYEPCGFNAKQILNQVESVIVAKGFSMNEVWITEIGYPYNRENSYSVMSKWMGDLENDNRVKFIFGYTAYGGRPRILDMIDDNGRLTETGKAYV